MVVEYNNYQEVSAMTERRGMLERLADFSYRNRGLTVLAWAAVLTAAFVFAPRTAGEYADDESTPGSQSKAAAALLAERFEGTSGDTFDVVWQAPAGVSAPNIEAKMERFLEQAGRLEGVGRADSPEVSPDGTIAVARLQLDRSSSDVPSETTSRLKEMAEKASGGLRVELGGFEEEGTPPEVYALLAAALILLVAFGSIVAAGLPLATALFGLGITTPLIGVVAAVVDTPDWAPAVAALLGIGVGIDYALLILTRFRSALGEGASRAPPSSRPFRRPGGACSSPAPRW
jgi:putative drug exporter of the RND superfamily